MWAPDYITLQELKDLVDVDDTEDDAYLSLLPSAVSRAVDRATLRQFGKTDTPEERVYRTKYSRSRGAWRAKIDDVQTTVGLVVPNTSYVLGPNNADLLGKPWTYVDFTEDPTGDRCGFMSMTATWGWTAVPDAIPLASLLQGNRWSSRKDSPFGIAGSPDQGTELRLLARVDPDVAVSLRNYRRDWWAA
jgi:hypothetical protein